ncbi:MAG: HesA/MoeB/ThiF family protein [Bacteroidia bacterium]|nr:HesA/MoeB/ThiF family protein [Bacteroidia bacterium]
MTNRYDRHIIMPEIGKDGQEKLSNAKVLVIGAGGLGCPVLQYLAAAGVGTLGIIDFDSVELSNLQRQVLFGESNLGQNKAIAAQERLADLNSDITIHAYPERLTPENAIAHFGNYDLVVDGSDNFETRYLVNDVSIITNTPFVYGAIYKFEGQVTVFNYKKGPTYRCLFPAPPSPENSPNCSSIGVLGVLPGIIGSMQANEAIKVILGSEGVLNGKLLCYDARSASTYHIGIKRNGTEIKKVIDEGIKSDNPFYTDSCSNSIAEITASKALELTDAIYYDIREEHELPKLIYPDYKSIPMSALTKSIDQFRNDKIKILVCQSGIRSLTAVSVLEKAGITKCYSLKEGVQTLNNKIKSGYERQKT